MVVSESIDLVCNRLFRTLSIISLKVLGLVTVIQRPSTSKVTRQRQQGKFSENDLPVAATILTLHN